MCREDISILSMYQNLNVWDVFWMNLLQMRYSRGKEVSGRKLGLVSDLWYARVLHEEFYIHDLLYDRETMVWREKGSHIIRCFLDIRRIDSV